MRNLSRGSDQGLVYFGFLKQGYEEVQLAKQEKRNREAATKAEALQQMIAIVDPILKDYAKARAFDGLNYDLKVKPYFKPNSRSLGYEKDGVGWLSIVDVAPQFDAEGNIEYLYVSLGKSINSPEPWTICPLSTEDLVSTIEELHWKQHN